MFCEILCEHYPLRTEQDDVRWAKARLDRVHARHDGLRLHEHTGPPTIRGIVRDVVAVCRKVTQVMNLDLE